LAAALLERSFRAKQADFFFRFRPCAPYTPRMVLRDENVSLRSEDLRSIAAKLAAMNPSALSSLEL
jgi:hypothetical protein